MSPVDFSTPVHLLHHADMPNEFIQHLSLPDNPESPTFCPFLCSLCITSFKHLVSLFFGLGSWPEVVVGQSIIQTLIHTLTDSRVPMPHGAPEGGRICSL